MFDQCRPNVYDVGPTLVKQCLDASCLRGHNVDGGLLVYTLCCYGIIILIRQARKERHPVGARQRSFFSVI